AAGRRRSRSAPPTPMVERVDRRRSLVGVALTLPALLVLALTMLYPVAWTVWLSLNGPATALSGAADFKGLGNYVRISGAPEVRAALWQTLEIVAASFLLEAVLGLTIALALHRGLKGSKVMSAIVALPLMVAPIVGALAWRFIFVDGYGMIDSIAGAFGADGPLWFADIWLARTSI